MHLNHHPAADRPSTATLSAWTVAACLAVGVPVLLAFNLSPSSTFLNQAAALAGWGVFIGMAGIDARRDGASKPPRWLILSLGLMLAACGAALAGGALPPSLAWSAIGMLLAALLAAVAAAQLDVSVTTGAPFRGLCLALQVAALASVAIAVVQYFFPGLADGDLIARPTSPGRVGANLRQPNHLSSLLLAALAATVWLREAALARQASGARLREVAFVAAVVALAFGTVLTVSRTGIVCILLLAGWGLVDRRLSRLSRGVLALLPVIFAALWFAVDAWSAAQAHAFAGDSQLHKSDLSSSRFGIWSNTLDLIRAHPWTGVGWGEFNFAWTLTPFPGRPIAFFDHTHNLPLQFAVEMGLPLAALVLGLLLVALGLAVRKAVVAIPEDLPAVRCSLVMVLMMGVHSLLEYPLWYAYFLLPTAFAFGVALSGREARDVAAQAEAEAARSARPSRLRPALLAGSVLLVAGAVWSVYDYWKVVQIFAPGDDAPSLEARIATGRTSVLFRHHAEYAAVTMAPNPSTEMAGFAIATHYLLDARLMTAWSKAYAELGDLDRARYLAQRLKEFRHPLGNAFFEPCNDPSVAPKPFQCTPPSRALTFEDFRGPGAVGARAVENSLSSRRTPGTTASQ